MVGNAQYKKMIFRSGSAVRTRTSQLRYQASSMASSIGVLVAYVGITQVKYCEVQRSLN